MLKSDKVFKMVIDNKYLMLVSKCIDRVASSAKYVNFTSIKKKEVNINCSCNDKGVIISSTLPASVEGKISVSVSKDKFVRMVKNLYDEGEVVIQCKGNKVNFKSGNIEATLIQVDCFESHVEYNEDMVYLDDGDSNEIINSIGKCIDVHVGNSFKDMGVFIDGSSKKYTRIGRLGPIAVSIISCNKIMVGEEFVNISTETAKIIGSLSEYDNKRLIFGHNNIIIIIDDMIYISMAKISNDAPIDYLEHFKLLDDKIVVDFSLYDKYKFNKNDLMGVVKMINDVLSKEESFLRWQLVGVDKFPVWEIYGLTYEEEKVSEVVSCVDVGDVVEKKFAVNSKSFLSAMKMFKEEILVLDNQDLPLVICDETGSDVVILAKAI